MTARPATQPPPAPPPASDREIAEQAVIDGQRLLTAAGRNTPWISPLFRRNHQAREQRMAAR